MFKNKKIIYGFLALFIGFAMSLSTVNAQVTGDERQDTQTQNSFVGKVIDATTGQALSDVTVKIEGQDQEATTDEEGKFTFENLQSQASSTDTDSEGGMGEVNTGEITIQIDHDGYQSLSETIRPEDLMQQQSPDSEPMTFELEPEQEDY